MTALSINKARADQARGNIESALKRYKAQLSGLSTGSAVYKSLLNRIEQLEGSLQEIDNAYQA